MPLTRRRLLTGLATALAAPAIHPARAGSAALNLYIWADDIDETVLADFQAETGISLLVDLFTSSEERQARMWAGASGYDLVLQSSLSLAPMAAEGVYQNLDRRLLRNFGQIDPTLLTLVGRHDPGNLLGLPYAWGSAGVTSNMGFLRQSLALNGPAGLETIFQPTSAAALAASGICLLDNPTDASFLILRMLGIDPAAAGPADYDRMVATVLPILAYTKPLASPDVAGALADQRLGLAMSWSDAATKARAAAPGLDLRYVVPRSGAPVWFDLWCLPADAPHVANAHVFLDYMLRPEVAARCTGFTGYANAIPASKALMAPALAHDPALFPDAETLRHLVAPAPLTADQRQALSRAWDKITRAQPSPIVRPHKITAD